MKALEFRRATVVDLPRIVQMKLAMFREAGHDGLLAPNAGELVLEDYRSMYASGIAQHFIACGEATVAMAGAFLKSDIPFRYFVNPTYGFIGDVYTDGSFRRRGLAAHLNKLALDWLASNSVTMVRLLASNAGRPLYERLGFAGSDEMVLVNAS
jgi:GNAT superfamily N-acetyltransferase